MQFRTSFCLMTLGQFLTTGLEFLAVVALFHRFGSIHGWSLSQVALLYGIVGSSYAVADATCRGFDQFSTLVKRGDFDRYLVRPYSTALQVASHEVQLLRIGRLLQAGIVLIWACWHLNLNSLDLSLVGMMLMGTTCTFAGLLILQATLTFYTVNTPEIVNALTYGGVETASFPLSIYPAWLSILFTWVVPLAFCGYMPVNNMIKSGHLTYMSFVMPLSGLLFLALSLMVWRIGEKHYTSTGS